VTELRGRIPTALVGALVGASTAAWVAAVLATLAGALDRGVAGLSLAAGLVAATVAGRQGWRADSSVDGPRQAWPHASPAHTRAHPSANPSGDPSRDPREDSSSDPSKGQEHGPSHERSDAVSDRPLDAPSTDRTWSPLDALALLAFAVVSVRQFGWLVFEAGGELRTLIPNNYGDLPLHWTYVQFLARGAPFWPENPIASGERLRYPFGVDLLTSLLVVLGAGMRTLLPLLGLAGAAAAALALRAWGGPLAVAGFLFSGGLVGFQVLWSGQLVDYQDAVQWKNLFLALFVPQRGLLLALPVGLVLLTSWRRRLLRGERGLPPWVEGALWGSLPLVHLHTFLVVSLLWAVWGLATSRLREAASPLAWAVVPATWAVWQVTDGFRAASLVGWAPGWTVGAANPLAFLAVNFGFFLPLALAALVLAWRKGDREHLLVLGPALAAFAALFVVRLAPWAWDNTKVMLWCYLLALPSIGTLVLARLATPWQVAAVVGLLFSGAVSVASASLGGGPRLDVLEIAEHEAVCRSLAPLSPPARVATAPTFNHPVALCGHPVVAGYAGHLWSHGIDASRVERDLEELMLGSPGWPERARVLGADYVFWGRRERAQWPASERPWEKAGSPVAEGPWGALYRMDRASD